MKLYITDLTRLIKNDFADVISKLSANDLHRLSFITNPHRRLQFLVGRMMIFKYFGHDFIIHTKGKPVSTKENLFFSLAHSHQYVVLAVAGQPVGIDIEKISTNRPFQAIAKRLRFKENLSCDEFYQSFTAYEADFKLGSEFETPYHQFATYNDFMLCISSINKEDFEIIESYF